MKKKPKKSKAAPKTLEEFLGERAVFMVREVAEILRTSPSTVHRWIKSGRVACLDLPGERRISRETVVGLVTNRPAAN